MQRLALLLACVSLTQAILRCPAIAAEPEQHEARASQPTNWNPYYPNRDSPRLTTPNWVGEPGVEAVVVLAIDDMRDTGQVRGLSPPDPEPAQGDRRPRRAQHHDQPGFAQTTPSFRSWLREGVSIECHTLTHPCPFWAKGDFAAAARTYHDCVDLMSQIPGNKPVAFRMPCCDSMNTVSPRFFSEIFAKKSRGGHSLSIDSSVFTVFTPDDPALPRDLVFDADGKERFRKYIPFPGFVNTIENYPYPYRIGDSCWEFPCIVPSDWEGQNLQQAVQPEDARRHEGGPRLRGAQTGGFQPRVSPARLDQVRAGRRADRLRREDLRHEGQVPEFPRGPRTAEQEPAIDRRICSIVRPRSPPGELPPRARFTDDQGRDAGLRFVDLDEDGYVDVVFSNDQDYGIYLYDPAAKGWTRKVMAGKAGAPGALPKIVRDGTNNGFFVHSRQLCWQNEDDGRSCQPGRSPLVQRSLEGRRAAGQVGRGLAEIDPGRAGIQGRAGGRRAAGQGPDRLRLGGRRQALGRRDGGLSTGLDGKGKPGGVVRYLEDENGDGIYDKQTTFLDGLGFPDRALALAERRAGRVCPGHLLCRGQGRRRQGRCSRGSLHRLQRRQPAASFQRLRAWPGRLGLRRQRRQRRAGPLAEDGKVDADQRPRLPVPARHRRVRGRERPDAVRPAPRRLGALVRQQQPQLGVALRAGRPRPEAQHQLTPPPDPRQTLEPDTRLFPISRTLARFNDLTMAGRVTSANSRDALPRRAVRARGSASSLFVSEPVHNLVHRIVLEPERQ